MEPRPNKLTAAQDAKAYVLAIFRRAEANDSTADWEEKLEILSEVVKHPDIDKILRDPRLSPSQLKDIMDPVMEKLKMNEEQREFMRILIDHKKLSLAPWIFEGFVKERKKANGLTDVRIISAFPLNDNQVANLTEALNKKFNIKAAPVTEVDPELIGGVKIVIGDRVIDQSTKGHLERMKRHLNKPPGA